MFRPPTKYSEYLQDVRKSIDYILKRVNATTVTKIIAGTNVTISPASGTGVVTINSTGGGGGGGLPVGGTAGQILSKIDSTNYNAEWIDNYALWTSTVKHEVKAGEAINKGQAVYVSSADGTNMIVSKASNATEATSSKTLGILAQSLAHNAKGFVITEGLLAGLDTSAANAAGDPVWLGTDGNLLFGLANKPYAPANMVSIGVVTRKNSNNGEIFIRIQNGFELDELHNVDARNPNNNDGIFYNSTTMLWEHKPVSAVYATPTLAQVTTAGNTTTNAITVGGLTVATNLIYTDTVNGRVGIGTTSPIEKVDITTSADNQFALVLKSVSGRLNLKPYLNSTYGVLIESTNLAKTAYNPLTLSGSKILMLDGNVIIGATGDSGYKLDVNGTARISDTATIAKALNITGTVAITGTGTTYANTFSSNINGTFSNATIATLLVNEASFSGTGSGILSYAIVAGSSLFSNITANSLSTFRDSAAAQLRVQGYNILTGASGDGSGTLLLTNRNSGAGALGLAATYGGGGSRISIFNQYNDGGTNSTSQIKVNITGTDIAIFAGSGELAIGKGAALSGASLTTSTSITAASAVARGVYFNNTLVAAANNDVLVGLDINPTFTNGAFTGVTNLALRAKGQVRFNASLGEVSSFQGYGSDVLRIYANANGLLEIGQNLVTPVGSPPAKATIYNRNNTYAAISINVPQSQLGYGSKITWSNQNQGGGAVYHSDAVLFDMGMVNQAGQYIHMFANGNVLLTGGTRTDAGYKLDVNGTARVSGSLLFGAAGSYLYGDTNNIRLYDKNNMIILQSFPNGVASSETYLQSSSGSRFLRIREDYMGLEWHNSNVSSVTENPIRVVRGFFGNVAATNKSVLLVQSTSFSNLSNATTLRGIYIDINDTTTYTGFTTVRAIEAPRGGAYFNTTSPHASAVLQADSTTQGFLQPRMTNAQVLAITTPATGLQAYDTTNNKNLLYNGTLWQNIATESWIADQGYITSQPWVVSGSDIYYNTGNVGIGTTTPTDIFHIVNNTNGNKFGRISAGAADASAAWVAQNDQVDNVVYRVFGSGVSGTQMGIALARSASLMANLGGSGKFLLGTFSNTDFVMGTGNAEKMRIVDSTGNVLIGTTTDAGNKLEVNGAINSTGYKINNTTGYTGILTIVTNPPGQQNVDIRGGIVVNIF